MRPIHGYLIPSSQHVFSMSFFEAVSGCIVQRLIERKHVFHRITVVISLLKAPKNKNCIHIGNRNICSGISFFVQYKRALYAKISNFRLLFTANVFHVLYIFHLFLNIHTCTQDEQTMQKLKLYNKHLCISSGIFLVFLKKTCLKGRRRGRDDIHVELVSPLF